jgi:heme oxygenase
MSATVLAQLYAETHPYHEVVDDPWYALLAQPIDSYRLRDTLVLVYGYEAAVEAACYANKFHALEELRWRERSGLIARDLLMLEMTPTQVTGLPQCLVTPFEHECDALGWMYVLHRSTELHQAVSRHVLSSPHPMAKAVNYLQAPSPRWDVFGEILEAAASTQANNDRIVEAARFAFLTARSWTDRAVAA